MAYKNRQDGADAQPSRGSTIGADYLNTTQLFSQTEELQTQDLTSDAASLAEEQRIQTAFTRAIEQHKSGRRVTFSEAVDKEARTPEEGDEVDGTTEKVAAGSTEGDGDGDDDLDTTSVVIRDILANLNRGAAQFTLEVQARPQYVYNLMGRLCAQLHLLKEHNDLLYQSNAVNKAKCERLATAHSELQGRLQDATEKITELSQEQNLDSNRRSTVQLVKMKEKNQWYADKLKAKEKTVDGLNSEIAELATVNEELTTERDRLYKELDAAEESIAARGRTPLRSQHREPVKSLSPWARDHLDENNDVNMAPPPLPIGRRARSGSQSKSRVRSLSLTQRRRHREGTAATDQSALSNASRASVNLDPTASMAIKSDRTVNNPDKFDGKIAFYPWLTSLILKLSTTTFREEADGLRFVQGFMSGALWASVAPRIPILGG
jgi:hypothetical protein